MKDGYPTEGETLIDNLDRNSRREAAARDLAQAIAACDPDDRLEFVEWVHEFLAAGFPIVLMGSVMEEAVFWADRASRAERKAYCLATFKRLSRDDQEAFLQHVQPAGPS